jgi:hypothetical protein
MFQEKDTGIQENTEGKKITLQKDSTQSYRYSGKHVRYENIVKNSTYGIGIQQKKVTERYRIKQTT